MRIVLAMVIAGCGSKPPPDPAFTPAGAKPCEQMADRVVGLMQVRDESGKPVDRDPETVDKITRVLIDVCVNDRWTLDAQRCFATLSDLREVDERCSPLLTVAQRDGFQRAFEAAFPK